MNRRSFLSFLSVAPVAVPMAAKAMAQPQGIWGYIEPGEFVVGTSEFTELSAEPFRGLAGAKPLAWGRVENFEPAIIRPSEMPFQIHETRTVAEQFDADLALLADDIDCHGDHEVIQQSRLSPESNLTS